MGSSKLAPLPPPIRGRLAPARTLALAARGRRTRGGDRALPLGRSRAVVGAQEVSRGPSPSVCHLGERLRRRPPPPSTRPALPGKRGTLGRRARARAQGGHHGRLVW